MRRCNADLSALSGSPEPMAGTNPSRGCENKSECQHLGNTAHAKTTVSKRPRRYVLSVSSVIPCAFLSLVVTAFLVGWMIAVGARVPHGREDGEEHGGAPSIFDRCRRPESSSSPLRDGVVKNSKCAYLHPARLLDPRQPLPHPLAIKHEAELRKSYESSNVLWGLFSFQAADFVGSPGLGIREISLRLTEEERERRGGQLNPAGRTSDGEESEAEGGDDPPATPLERYASLSSRVRSVTVLAAPKCASRSLRELFTRRIADRKRKAATTGAGLGRVTAEFAERLERAQREDGVVTGKDPARDGIGGLLGFFTPWASLWLRLSPPRQHSRRDIVLSVARNPVQRFVSSATQLLSMRGRKVCWGCKAHLEPCLRPSVHDGAGDDGGGSSFGTGGIERKGDLDPVGVLRCLIRSIDEHGFWNEHLIPWVHFVRTPLVGRDIEVAVFEIEGMGEIMTEFAAVEEGDPSGQDQAGQIDPFSSSSIAAAGMTKSDNDRGAGRGVEGGGNIAAGLHLNKFDSRKAMSRKGEVLRGLADKIRGLSAEDANWGLSKMPADMLKDLCRLYAIDVDVMEYLGFGVKVC
uniref:Sulfotransferase n=1 Tax=Odontella aurita TaxID=265563 RepID=A0A7S4N147_9STRA|mmetsp:Transcript_4333/g.12105  ORF Transcript_4333/g.12105 Transcript_4333/m.12105 type:complete len:578 (+) Transcript_4333:440-2173(+)